MRKIHITSFFKFGFMKIICLYVLVMVLFISSCKQKNNLSTREGFIHLKVGKVWYRIVGTGDKAPLLLLHGGPGVPSYYLNSMAALGNDRPVIFLDQPGCGRSDRNIDSTLMTVESFVNELKEFTDSLHLTSFYLYGHSWGTMLGMDYYLKYPENIKGIIFASPCIAVLIESGSVLISESASLCQNGTLRHGLAKIIPLIFSGYFK